MKQDKEAITDILSAIAQAQLALSAAERDFQDDDKGEVVIKGNGAEEARLAWNTRAPILSAEEMEMLDAKD